MPTNVATFKFCSKKNSVEEDGKKRIFTTYYAIRVVKNGEYYDNLLRKEVDPNTGKQEVISFTVHPTSDFKPTFEKLKFPFIATLSPDDIGDDGKKLWFITTDKDKDGVVRLYKNGRKIETIVVSGFAHTFPVPFKPVDFDVF